MIAYLAKFVLMLILGEISVNNRLGKQNRYIFVAIDRINSDASLILTPYI